MLNIWSQRGVVIWLYGCEYLCWKTINLCLNGTYRICWWRHTSYDIWLLLLCGCYNGGEEWWRFYSAPTYDSWVRTDIGTLICVNNFHSSSLLWKHWKKILGVNRHILEAKIPKHMPFTNPHCASWVDYRLILLKEAGLCFNGFRLVYLRGNFTQILFRSHLRLWADFTRVRKPRNKIVSDSVWKIY